MSAPPPVPLGIPPAARAIGVRGAILAVQGWFYTLSVTDSTVFGGGWNAWLSQFQFYILIFLAGTVIETTVAVRKGMKGWPKGQIEVPMLPDEDAPGAAENYLKWLGAFLIGGILGGITILHLLHVDLTKTLSGQQSIDTVVFVLIFVAPTEEYFFRAVLGNRLGGFWSIFAFAVYHIGTYTATSGFGLGTLTILIQLGILGAILWVVYDYRRADGTRLFGLGGATGIHAFYDLFAFGVIGGSFSIGLFHLAVI